MRQCFILPRAAEGMPAYLKTEGEEAVSGRRSMQPGQAFAAFHGVDGHAENGEPVDGEFQAFRCPPDAPVHESALGSALAVGRPMPQAPENQHPNAMQLGAPHRMSQQQHRVVGSPTDFQQQQYREDESPHMSPDRSALPPHHHRAQVPRPPRFIQTPPMHATQPHFSHMEGVDGAFKIPVSHQSSTPSPSNSTSTTTPSIPQSPFHQHSAGQGEHALDNDYDDMLADMLQKTQLQDMTGSPTHPRSQSSNGSGTLWDSSPSRGGGGGGGGGMLGQIDLQMMLFLQQQQQAADQQRQMNALSGAVASGLGGLANQLACMSPADKQVLQLQLQMQIQQQQNQQQQQSQSQALEMARMQMQGLAAAGMMQRQAGPGGHANDNMHAQGGVQGDWTPKGYKTVICKFWEKNVCTKGPACTFAHGADELKRFTTCVPALRSAPAGPGLGTMSSAPLKMDRYKTKLCLFHLQGRCCKGPHCPYAHGMDQLRGAMPPTLLSALHQRLSSSAVGSVQGLADLAGGASSGGVPDPEEQALRAYLDEYQVQQVQEQLAQQQVPRQSPIQPQREQMLMRSMGISSKTVGVGGAGVAGKMNMGGMMNMSGEGQQGSPDSDRSGGGGGIGMVNGAVGGQRSPMHSQACGVYGNSLQQQAHANVRAIGHIGTASPQSPGAIAPFRQGLSPGSPQDPRLRIRGQSPQEHNIAYSSHQFAMAPDAQW